jgi:hypothetical protein
MVGLSKFCKRRYNSNLKEEYLEVMENEVFKKIEWLEENKLQQ